MNDQAIPVQFSSKYLPTPVEALLCFGLYRTENLAVFVVDAHLHEPLMTISTNIPEYNFLLNPNEFFVKNYSENEGIEEFLKSSGLFADSGKRIMLEGQEETVLILPIYAFTGVKQ